MNIQLNNRHITQLEELESLKGKLQCPSQRSRNLSSDRQYTSSLTSEFRSTRNSDQQKDSQSVEKFLNLKQQNQNVNNLSQLWKQQRQSISLTQSLHAQNSIQEKFEADQQIPKYTHLVIEEEENLVNEQDATKIKVVQAANNVKVNGKFLAQQKLGGQKKNQQQAQSIQTSNNQGQNKKTNNNNSISNNNNNNNNNNNSIRPQTTKSQAQVPQTPQTQKRTIQKSNTKSFQDTFLDIPQTPSQKLKQSSLLEKTRQGKVNQVVSKAITSKRNSDDDEKNLIFQLSKLKESVTKLYDNRFEKQLSHSSQFIEKNFDQIINTLKLDFRFLENDM